MTQPSRIDRIVEQLLGSDESVRESASTELHRIAKEGLSMEESHQALRTAAQTFPARRNDFQDSSSDLIFAVAAHSSPDHIAIVLEVFSQLSLKARSAALNLVARIEEREAAVAYMEIVRTYARSGGLSELIIWPLRMPLRHIDVFFPELLDYASIPELALHIFEFCLAACEKHLLDSVLLTAYAQVILVTYQPLRNFLVTRQQSKGIGWMWEDNYWKPREDCGVLLDLMGYVHTPEIAMELKQAVAFADTKLKAFAVASSLRQDMSVSPKEIAAAASDPAVRNWLYGSLQAMDRMAGFPDEFRTQEAFAESDMVGWLTFGAELGRAPDEIELMKTVSIDTETEDGVLDYFVFRFRTFEPHWAAERGWVAGISGPFLRNDAPSTKSYGDTFSTFALWDSRSPDEHLGDVQDLIDRWRDYHSKGQL